MNAIEKAKDLAISKDDSPENYEKYYVEPNPLEASPDSTVEGLVVNYNKLEDDGIGAGIILSSELADEIDRGIAEIVQLVSETYDLGRREVKAIKGSKDNLQSKPLHNFPINALFMGSQSMFMADKSIRDKFKKMFESKLSRRTFFCYTPESLPAPKCETIEDIDRWEDTYRTEAKESRTRVVKQIEERLKGLTNQTNITVHPKVTTLFNRYKLYNGVEAELSYANMPITRLSREHLQWKALKVAGALATYEGKDIIEVEDYLGAIALSELLIKDINNFEHELSKQMHEIFADHMNNQLVNNKTSIRYHDIKKLGYIQSSGDIDKNITNLVKAAQSYDNDGVYTIEDSHVYLTHFPKKPTGTVSFKSLNFEGIYAAQEIGDMESAQISKNHASANASKDFEQYDIEFNEFKDLLSTDGAFVTFGLKDGHRTEQNINTPTKFLVFDVDKTDIDRINMHYIISNINHFIVATSDKNNDYRYRIILELDSPIELSAALYKHFVQAVADDLLITQDPLPKAQVYFTYENSAETLLSVLDAEPLKSQKYVLEATIKYKERKDRKPIFQITQEQKETQLKNKFSTFDYAYEAPYGEGGVNLYKAWKHAYDLGATLEYTLELVNDINDYWDDPMEAGRFKRTVLDPINAVYAKG